jgi:hypothetical protein
MKREYNFVSLPVSNSVNFHHADPCKCHVFLKN